MLDSGTLVITARDLQPTVSLVFFVAFIQAGTPLLRCSVPSAYLVDMGDVIFPAHRLVAPGSMSECNDSVSSQLSWLLWDV